MGKLKVKGATVTAAGKEIKVIDSGEIKIDEKAPTKNPNEKSDDMIV